MVSALALMAALLVAGCGGGSSSSDGSTTGGETGETLTRVAFVKQANAICEKSQKVREERLQTANAWVKPGEGMTRPLREKIIRFMLVEPTETLSQELQELGPVSGGDADAESFAQVLAEDAEGAQIKPLTAISGAAFAKSVALARKVGLTSCLV
jgi:hypothetical protein